MTSGLRRSPQAARGLFLALSLLALAALNFALRTPQYGLIHEDWTHFHNVAVGDKAVWNDVILRPLHTLPWKVCGLVFGEHLSGYYAVLFTLEWLTALLLYRLARRYVTAPKAAAWAALFMVFPADASHVWLSSMPMRTAFLLAAMALYLGEKSRDRGELVWMLPAGALALFSLSLYELQFPLLVAWPLVAFFLGASWHRRQGLAWSVWPALYLGWRFLYRPLSGSAAIVNTRLDFDLPAFFERLLFRVPFNLAVEGWGIGLRELVGRPLLALAFFAVVFFAAGWAVKVLGRDVDKRDGDRGALAPGRMALLAAFLIVLGVGMLVPTTYWIGRTAGAFGGRIFSCALPGAALLALVAVGLLRPALVRRAAFALLLTLAFGFHWNVQRLAAANWQVQQELIRALAERPPPKPDSFLLITGLPANRLGFGMPWGTGRMIREVYGDDTLSGIGVSQDRDLAHEISVHDGKIGVRVAGNLKVALEQVIVLAWEDGRLIREDHRRLMS